MLYFEKMQIRSFYKVSIICSAILLLSTCVIFKESKFNKKYLAAEVSTKESYLYGKFIVRMSAAGTPGIISNFFTFRNNGQKANESWQEIDLEVFGKPARFQLQSNIIVDLERRTRSEALHQTSELRDIYNTYELEWSPGKVRWLLNGFELRVDESVSAKALNSPASFRFNIWLPDDKVWVGEASSNNLPVNMSVNWVEYYRWNGNDFVFSWRDDFDYFDNERWEKASHTFERNLAQFLPQNVYTIDGYLTLHVSNKYSKGPFQPPLRDSH